MAMAAWNKCLLLLALLLLCFISYTSRAEAHNNAKAATSNVHGGDEEGIKDHDLVVPKENATSNSYEVSVMDYSPARKRPPIHN